jgi:hypothetical protein
MILPLLIEADFVVCLCGGVKWVVEVRREE